MSTILGMGHGALVLSVAVGAASRREVWGMGHWTWEIRETREKNCCLVPLVPLVPHLIF